MLKPFLKQLNCSMKTKFLPLMQKGKTDILNRLCRVIHTGRLCVLFYLSKKKHKAKIQMQLQMQEEKERLSRDLHDNLGSQMALLSNNVESLDINYRKQTGIDENIDRVKGTAKQLLQTLRETIWILNKEQVTAEDFLINWLNMPTGFCNLIRI